MKPNTGAMPAISGPVGVVGMGYVGLPLALNFCGAGRTVYALDIDPEKISALNAGRSYIKHIPDADIQRALEVGLLKPDLDMASASHCSAIIICVPTPLSKHLEPDLSYVVNTMESLLPHLQPGQLVSLESTTYPGTTEEVLRPRVESRGFTVGQDFYLAYSPEREDPGNADFPSHLIPKLVSGVTPECLQRAVALYQVGYQTIVPVTSTKVAEFAKLLENTYRSVNIGLVNELKMVADKMGIDIWDVINAAATKPFGYKAFYPGPGVGGHCIPVDPFYLTWKAKEFGIHTRFVELAAEINRTMPGYVVEKTADILNRDRLPLNGSRILALGLAFKADVDDLRESPTFAIMDLLAEKGALVDYYDPHIPDIHMTREHAAWAGKNSIAWTQEVISSFDCVIICTGHRCIDKQQLTDWSARIVDSRNFLDGYCPSAVHQKIIKA